MSQQGVVSILTKRRLVSMSTKGISFEVACVNMGDEIRKRAACQIRAWSLGDTLTLLPFEQTAWSKDSWEPSPVNIDESVTARMNDGRDEALAILEGVELESLHGEAIMTLMESSMADVSEKGPYFKEIDMPWYRALCGPQGEHLLKQRIIEPMPDEEAQPKLKVVFPPPGSD